MKKFIAGLGLASMFLPFVALAQNFGDNTVVGASENAKNALRSLTGVVNTIIPFLIAIAVVVFLYGVITYVLRPGPEEKAQARSYIIYGIIGIAVMLSIFGLVALLRDTLGLTSSNLSSDQFPTIDVPIN